MPQDMPPNGGYSAVQYKRNIAPLALRPSLWMLGMGVVMVYGWSKLIPGLRELNELGREKTWSRLYLVPMLQAEEDRDQYRRYLADQERERQMFGKATSPYHSDRFVRPTYAVVPSRD